MSDFVQFPDQVYLDAGDVFAAFDGSKSAFSLENARAMMWFAQLAYEVDTSGANATLAKIDRIRSLWHFEPVTPFRKQAASLGKTFDTTGVFGERKDAVVLAFAGTDPAIWETVATDSRFVRSRATDTHEGFQAAADAIANEARQAVQLSQARNKPLFIAGHSMGAAIAIISANAAAAGGTPPRAVYGFGTPRVGGTTFHDAYTPRLGEVTYRVVHARDVVGRVPSFLGYRHVGHVLACGVGEKFAANRLSPDLPDAPTADATYLAQMFMTGGLNAAGAFAGLLGGALHGDTGEAVRQALAKLLQPVGHGPLGEMFKFLPPPIREHLQDQYIEALTP